MNAFRQTVSLLLRTPIQTSNRYFSGSPQCLLEQYNSEDGIYPKLTPNQVTAILEMGQDDAEINHEAVRT